MEQKTIGILFRMYIIRNDGHIIEKKQERCIYITVKKSEWYIDCMSCIGMICWLYVMYRSISTDILLHICHRYHVKLSNIQSNHFRKIIKNIYFQFTTLKSILCWNSKLISIPWTVFFLLLLSLSMISKYWILI